MFTSWKRLPWRTVSPLARALPTPKQTAPIASVTSGPATATRNSTPGDSVSRPSLATPPNIQRSMPRIGMPLRIATTACPSSCSRIVRKNSSAEMTASENAFVSSPGNRSPYQPESDQMIRNRTKNQLTSTPMRMPKTRASWMDPPPNIGTKGGRGRDSETIWRGLADGSEVVDTPGRVRRDLHAAARRDGGERRAAGHPRRPRRDLHGHAVGGGRLRAGARHAAARLGLARRPARAAHDLRVRHRAVRGRLVRLRPGRLAVGPQRRARRAGHWRGHDVRHLAGADRPG